MALAEAAWKRDTVRTERARKTDSFHTVEYPPRNSITQSVCIIGHWFTSRHSVLQALYCLYVYYVVYRIQLYYVVCY